MVQVSGKKIQVPIVAAAKRPRESLIFRKDDKWAVWDPKRGLTVRVGNRASSTKLPDIALSPKMFPSDAIRETQGLIRRGIRRREASSLAGARRIGDVTYWLIRWSDKSGHPWMEALVRVDFAEPRPVPRLIGKFDTLSLASEPIDDRLLILEKQLSIVGKQPSGWGLSRYDPEAGVFSAILIGGELQSYFSLSSRLGIFLERTPHGSTLVGRVDLLGVFRRTLFETRGAVELIDNEDPLIARIRRGGMAILRNIESGAEVRVPVSSSTRRTELGVLVWWPSDKPKSAVLYDPSRWTALVRMQPEDRRAK